MTGTAGRPSPVQSVLACGFAHPGVLHPRAACTPRCVRPPMDVWVSTLGPAWSHPTWNLQFPKVASVPHLQDLGEGPPSWRVPGGLGDSEALQAWGVPVASLRPGRHGV